MAKFVKISNNRIINVEQITLINPPGREEQDTGAYRVHFADKWKEDITREDVNLIVAAGGIVWTEEIQY